MKDDKEYHRRKLNMLISGMSGAEREQFWFESRSIVAEGDPGSLIAVSDDDGGLLDQPGQVGSG